MPKECCATESFAPSSGSDWVGARRCLVKKRVPESKGSKGYQQYPSDPSGERLNGHRSQERRHLRVAEPPPDTLDSPWPGEVHGFEQQCRTAKEPDQVDVVSGGRLIFGIGVGYIERESAALGVPFDGRGTRAEEYLAAIRAIWMQEHPRYEGTTVAFEGVQAHPRPAQRP